MFKKYFLNLLFILLFFLVIFSLSHFFTFHYFIWLVALIFCLMLFDKSISFFWLATWAILLDLFSITPFGFFIFILSLIYLLLDYLIQHFLTNKSLTTFFFLNFIGFVVFQSLYAFGIFILNIFSWPNFYSFDLKILLIQLAVNLFFAFILFIITKFFSTRLQVHTLHHF